MPITLSRRDRQRRFTRLRLLNVHSSPSVRLYVRSTMPRCSTESLAPASSLPI
ncbi:hypothetical protein [Marilutibacter alkalisoli]|uniref:hypothetical protein n=1 Tax=Marilutibacter alkalisoli TaxID=2591633 RepID=UPI0014237B4F|nr:hypothetical protein [Lysobacter alkalisoli]